MKWLAICLLVALCSPGLSTAQPDNGSYVGLRVREVTAERAQELKLDSQRGAEVVGVEDESPAARAGIQTGDVLLTYNGENVVGTQQLGRLVSETPPGRRINVHLWRSGQMRSLWMVTAAKQPPEPSLPDFAIPTADIPGSLIVWRNRILGTVCETLPPQLSAFFGVPRGVLVRDVDKGALGYLAGFKAGDVIVATSDRPILNPRDLTGALLSDTGVLHPARFAVWREHKRIFIDVHPPE